MIFTKIFKWVLPLVNQFYLYSEGKETILFVKQALKKKSIHESVYYIVMERNTTSYL